MEVEESTPFEDFVEIIRINQKQLLITLDEELDELRIVDLKLVGSDLPRPKLGEEDSYGGGGVKISAVGVSTTARRSRQRSSSSSAMME